MGNAVLILNSFLSYLLLFIIVVAVVLVGIFIGISLRKKSNEKEALLTTGEDDIDMNSVK